MAFVDSLGVVIDAGSRNTKAGFIGDYFPRAFFPTVIGRFRHEKLLDGFPEIYHGHDAIKRRGLSKLTWPVRGGLIQSWDDIEKLWYFLFFKELKVPPEQSKVLHAVNPLIPRGDREKMAEIFFESFSVSHLYLAKSPVLILHASGRTTGVVYENGASSSFVSPVFEGFPLRHTIIPNELTGEALSKGLNNMLNALGYSFTTPVEMDIIEDVKAKLCYVASDYKSECDKYDASGENKVKYDLPDGQHIILGKERFKLPETLFNPSIVNLHYPSIVDLIYKSIDTCDDDIKINLYENIVVSGGSTLFPGLNSRLNEELRRKIIDRPGFKAVINDLPKNDIAAWIGGSMLGTMDSLKEIWMSRQEYEDIGPDRVNYKFF